MVLVYIYVCVCVCVCICVCYFLFFFLLFLFLFFFFFLLVLFLFFLSFFFFFCGGGSIFFFKCGRAEFIFIMLRCYCQVGITNLQLGPEFKEYSNRLNEYLSKKLRFKTKDGVDLEVYLDSSSQQEYITSTQLPASISDQRLLALRRVFNASHLPSLSDVIEAFPWLDPSSSPTTLTLDQALRPLSSDVKADMITPLSWLYMFSNPYYKVCELITSEYIDALSSYLISRIRPMVFPSSGPPRTNKVLILELGAGNGRLTYMLSIAIRRSAPELQDKFIFVATDAQGIVDEVTRKYKL